MAGDLTEEVCFSIKSREITNSTDSAAYDEVVKEEEYEGAEGAPIAL